MREHPIPQDVTGYRFHIVGNMTLKQFAQVGAGVLLAVIVYNTNLLFFIKWPLILVLVGLGGMLAFVPIEERPLDHWIVTFIRRLYSPTKFYWKREEKVPFAFTTDKKETKTPAHEAELEVDLTPARAERIRAYLESVKQPAPIDELEATEAGRISQILETFDDVSVETVESKPQKMKPQLNPRVRNLAPVEKGGESSLKNQIIFSRQQKQQAATEKAATLVDRNQQAEKLMQSVAHQAPLSSSAKTTPRKTPPAPAEIFGENDVDPSA